MVESGVLCSESGKPIGRLPRRERIICEVCGKEVNVTQPTPKEARRGLQARYGAHTPKSKSARPNGNATKGQGTLG